MVAAFFYYHVLHVEIIIETATTRESTKLEKGWLAQKGKRRPGLFRLDCSAARVTNKEDNNTAETKNRTIMSGGASDIRKGVHSCVIR